MEELIKLLAHYERYHFELTYSSITHWRLKIYKLGYTEKGDDPIIFEEQNIDCHYLIAKAEVKFKDYLIERRGYY